MVGSKDFKEKFGIVTGATSGIGRATALHLADRGGGIAIVDLNLEQVKKVEQEVSQRGSRAVAIHADVTREEDVDRMVQETLDSFGAIDFLVNNAGIMRPTLFLDLHPTEWDQIIAVNLRGPYLCCRAVIPHMIKRKKATS